MHLEEGQLYEGSISISGGDGPFRRWIVVSPFGKTHIHSIDDPLEMRCWPAALVGSGIETGRLRYVGRDPRHPAIEVQRIKEKLGVRDAHLSISMDCLERLVAALHAAVAAGDGTAPYLGGEILSAAAHSALMSGQREDIRARVLALLDGDAGIGLPAAGGFSNEVGALPLPT